MVVGDFPIETDTIVIGRVLVDMIIRLMTQLGQKLLSLRKVTGGVC